MRADTVRNRAKLRRRQRGAALVMVLLAIVVLTVFLTDVQQQSATAFSSAIAARERLKAEYHARSAVNLARLLIATEPTIRRAVSPMFAMISKGKKMPQIPVWEFSDQVLGAYNCPERATGFNALTGVSASEGEGLGLGKGKGCFDVVVVDEDAKVNVNTAARGDIISRTRVAAQLLGVMAGPQYNPLFENPDADGQHSDRFTICGALIDWADPDEETESCNLTANAPTSGGVEDNFYQTIGLPYFRKNAAYDSLEELRMVRGVSDDFWATFVDPDPRNPRKRVITVWGQGKVNINTANAQTLLALVCANAIEGTPLCIDPLQAAAFIQIVSLAKSFTAGAPLFSSPADFIKTMKGAGIIGPTMQSLGIQPVTFKSDAEMKKMLTTKSKMFSIYAEGVVAGHNRETRVSIHTVIDFRSATDISQMGPGGLAGLGGLSGLLEQGATGSNAAGTSGAGDDQTADALMAALTSNPAGQIVYWRVQ